MLRVSRPMCSLCPLWLTFLSSFFVFFVRFVVRIGFCVLTAPAFTHYPRGEWLPYTTELWRCPMSEQLSKEDYQKLLAAENASFPSPIPTQEVSNGEFMPNRQSRKQREFEARIKDMGESLGERHGVSRRHRKRTLRGGAPATPPWSRSWSRASM